MSKKKLLEESTIRKFMKFANLGHLAENFVDEAMYEDDPEADLPPEPEDAEMEEEPMEDEPAAEGKEELLARVVQAVATELGVEAEVEGAGGEEMGAEDEEGLDMSPEAEAEEAAIEPSPDFEPAEDELGDEPPLDPEAQAVLARGIQAMADAMGMGDLVTVDVEPEAGEVEDVVDMTDVELDEPIEPAGEEGGELDFEMGPEDEEEPVMEGELPPKMQQPKFKATPRKDRKAMKKAGMTDQTPRQQKKSEKEWHKLQAPLYAEPEDQTEEPVNEGDAIVAEVSRRVAARLQRESRQAEVVDQLAERIMKRLTK